MARTVRKSLLGILDTGRPELRLAYPRTYIVRACDPATGLLDLDPPADDAGADLRPLDKVEQWNLGGAILFPTRGRAVLVTFRDALETRPVVTGFAPEAPGAAAARVGDHAGRLYWDTATGPVGIYYAPTEGGPYLPIVSGVGPPLPAVPGTSVTISTGSAEIKIA